MIGKVMKGATFKGCVNYVLGKENAKLLDADGVLLGTKENIISSLNAQRLLKPNIKHPVGHISLSYSADDKDKLTDTAMVRLAREYMNEMGIKDTQYILVRHFDNGNPHVHLVYNRIANNGKTISDKNDRYRNEAACKKIKDKYGLTYGNGKDNVKQHRLKGKDKTKYEIYHAVKDSLSKSNNWTDFTRLLANKGVQAQFKYKSGTTEVQGVSFVKDGITFKGSEVDRSFSFSKLDKQMVENGKAVENTQVQADLVGSSVLTFVRSSVPTDDSDDLEQGARQAQYEQEKINRKKKRKKGGSFKI